MTLKELLNGGSIVNLTPHQITVIVDEKDHVIPASRLDNVVRASRKGTREVFEGIFEEGNWEAPNLPSPEQGKVFLVSLAVATAMAVNGIKRDDIFVCGTGPQDNPRRHEGTRFITGIRLLKFANR